MADPSQIRSAMAAASLAILLAGGAAAAGGAGRGGGLECVAPVAQRVAGGAIDFHARIALDGAQDGRDAEARIADVDLCGAFSGKQICGLIAKGSLKPSPRASSQSPATSGRAAGVYDVNFHLSGFTQPAEHEYTLWLQAKSAATDLTASLSSCSGSFQTVPFPGWDSYVQSYYNASETLRSLDEDMPPRIARVGRPDHAVASFERMPDLLGPSIDAPHDQDVAPPAPKKALLVTFAGKNSIEHIDALATQFTQPGSRFTFILFAYDRTNWARFDWIERATVIRVTGTMKWRFVRTFLQPSLVAAYSHVVIMDEDCSIEGLDMEAFLDDMHRAGVQIGQPANGVGSYGSHKVVRQQEGRGVVWTNFVECGVRASFFSVVALLNPCACLTSETLSFRSFVGVSLAHAQHTHTHTRMCAFAPPMVKTLPQPLVSFDASVWPCVFNEILFPDITCGYGLDLVWTHCGRTAVLHDHAMVHENLKPASNRPNFVMRCAAEGLALFQRLAHRGITPVDPAEVASPPAAAGLSTLS